MPLETAQEDSAYKCSQCGQIINAKKGQMLPPCPKCGGGMKKHEGAVGEPPGCK